MYEADELSDRVAFIDRGRVLAMDAPEELKLAHGTRTVRVRVREGPGVEEEVIELDGDAAGERLRTLLASGDVLTIHTEEATLEDVFVAFAGRGLT
jgi:ABC-type multidrug transport system ATPase subunit